MHRTTRSPSPRNGAHGALILIVLIALAIGLYLMFGNMGGTSYMQQVAKTKKEGNAMAISIQGQQLATLVSAYRMEHNGKPPTSLKDLGNDAGAFNDQWGNPLRFSFEGPKPADSKVLIVVSDGPDGQAGTPDDITERHPLQF